MKTKRPILLALLLPGLLLAAPGDSKKEKPFEPPAINLWVDFALGLISEEDAKAKMKSPGVDFKDTLESEVKPLAGDLYGVRQVSGKQFAAIVADMDKVNSFFSTSVIGETKERGYLEVEIHLSNHSYVAIVSAPLDDLPDATRNKLRELVAMDPKGASKK
jgi:hypothetical protein